MAMPSGSVEGCRLSAVKTMRPRRSHKSIVWAGLCLSLAMLLVSRCCASAWVPPAATATRRATAASFAAAVFGVAADPQKVWAQDGRAGMPGENEEMDPGNLKDSDEIVAKRRAARQAGEERRKKVKEQFRDLFAEFAADEADIPTRVEKLAALEKIIKTEKMLPIGITLKDVIEGTQAVKFNLGCVKLKVKQGDCKVLEKGIQKLTVAIEKTKDLSVIQR